MGLANPGHIQNRGANLRSVSKQSHRHSIWGKPKATNNRLFKDKRYYFCIKGSSDSINCNSSHVFTVQHFEHLENLEELG
jgi:hypothetical protein